MSNDRSVSHRLFWGACALLFVASAAATIGWWKSMSAAGEMPMAGGWSMSMAWMRMPGQSWPGAAASFVGMWVVMMAAMMLPSLVPMLMGYRRSVCRTDDTRLGGLTALVGAGYFFVWSLLGAAVFAIGASIAAAEMRWSALARTAPMLAGVVVLSAGLIQFTEWKARRLACCRERQQRVGGVDGAPADAGWAWRHGVYLGMQCCRCCAGHTAALLAIGVMDVRAMTVVAIAITLERLAPGAERAAQAVGIAAAGTGLLLLARAAGL